MLRVFVSSHQIDGIQASVLIQRLSSEKFQVSYSPRNSNDGDDARWNNWYSKRCQDELDDIDVFIAMIDDKWIYSTWMMHELHEARKRMINGQLKHLYFYNPNHIDMDRVQMKFNPQERLPDEIDEVVQRLEASNKND